MDFNIKKPTHIFVLLALIVAFLVIVVLPILIFFGMFSSIESIQIGEMSESVRLTVEIVALLFQIILILGLFVGVPLLWYSLVNKLSFKEMLSRLKLKFERIDTAILWGVVTAIVAVIIMISIGILLTVLGFDLTNASNITEIEMYFSLPSILFLIIFQPITEEIFFRGFLLEKIDSLIGEKTAIIVTAILFGIAHLSFENVYPAFTISIVGILFGFLLVKTRNLYSVIIAHILLNLISFSMYMLGKSFI